MANAQGTHDTLGYKNAIKEPLQNLTIRAGRFWFRA